MEVTDLKNSKIYLSNMDDRLDFQKKIFELGVKWNDDSNHVQYLKENFYYINNRLRLELGSKINPALFFTEHKYKQIFLFDVLNINESNEHMFEHFDKVLVRQSSNDVWKPRLFSGYNDEILNKYGTTDGIFYMECLPYEGNSELAGTKL